MSTVNTSAKQLTVVKALEMFIILYNTTTHQEQRDLTLQILH